MAFVGGFGYVSHDTTLFLSLFIYHGIDMILFIIHIDIDLLQAISFSQFW